MTLQQYNPNKVVHNIDFHENGIEHQFVTSKFSRILALDASTRKYERQTGKTKAQLHWGQRKLLMSEIEFLTMYWHLVRNSNLVIIYAGAAPGTHVKYLAKLFPGVQFRLYDPRDFDDTLVGNKQITTFQEYFTDKTARALAREMKAANAPPPSKKRRRKQTPAFTYLFVCDIRTGPDETHVVADMVMQAKWVKLMRHGISAAILKFRLPWTQVADQEIQTTYLAGDVHLPVWGPKTTTECRLVVNLVEQKLKQRKWNATLYENQMFYFNTITRKQYYVAAQVHVAARAQAAHKICINTAEDLKISSLCCCYDCTAEIHILRNYIAVVKGMNMQTCDDLHTRITRISSEISRSLGFASIVAYYKFKAISTVPKLNASKTLGKAQRRKYLADLKKWVEN